MTSAPAASGEAATPFPTGAWFSVVGNIRLGAGGQTRMVLLRHRLFLAAGLDLPILTYNPVASYDAVRAGLLSDGLLSPESRLLNLHEDLRTRDLSSLPEVAVPIGQPRHAGEAYRSALEITPTIEDVEDGYTWRLRHLDAKGSETAWEFLRPDGSTYAITPADEMVGDTRVLDRDGRVVMAGNGLGDLWRWWTRLLTPAEGTVFLVSDSRFIAVELGLIDDPRFVLMHQMHNPHVQGERRWDSPYLPSYATLMEHLDRFDALNTLTERQRRDLVMRVGELDQFEVIANPVEVVEPPVPAPDRVRGRIVMITRLHRQKQIDKALEAFAALAVEHPDATLEIYGDGAEEEALRALADDLGLATRVTFHGHVTGAADLLWAADLAWLTSRFEGYPLFPLEARMRGCPVVSFDVPYGPAEQIESGVDGILVPAGDAAALARETSRLLSDRPRLEAMRAPARERAVAHGHASFLADWARVAQRALERKTTRVRLDDVTVQIRGRTAQVDVRGEGDPADVVIRWEGWRPGDDEPTDLTVGVERDRTTFTIRAERAARGSQERLLLTWRNVTWQRPIAARRWFGR